MTHPPSLSPNLEKPVIEIKNLVTNFGSTLIHENLNLTVFKGEIIGIIGGSGSGKSVLLRTILGLNPPQSGSIKLLGKDLATGQF